MGVLFGPPRSRARAHVRPTAYMVAGPLLVALSTKFSRHVRAAEVDCQD